MVRLKGWSQGRHRCKGWLTLLLACSSLLSALCTLPLASVQAAEAPPAITPFSTAHVRIEGTISAQGQDLPVQGEGDIDARKGASHLTVALLGATFETIALDGRTYRRSATTGRWEYSEGAATGGFDPARLAPYDPNTIRAAGSNFTRVGTEVITGEPTMHWRADVDLARLLGGIPGAGGGDVRTTSSTMELWIGAADGRLRRLSLNAQGTVTNNGATNAFRLALLLTFSKFDQEVAIIAPPGAVPATPAIGGTPFARGTVAAPLGVLPTATLTPIGEVTSRTGVVSATHIIRVVALLSLAVIAVVVGLAVARGGRQRGTRP